MNQQGFSLLEYLIALALFSILITILFNLEIQAKQSIRSLLAIQQFSMVANAVSQYQQPLLQQWLAKTMDQKNIFIGILNWQPGKQQLSLQISKKSTLTLP